MKKLNRRDFIKSSIAAGATASLWPLTGCKTQPKPHAKIIGANDDVRIAVVGLNSRGKNHIDKGYGDMKGVRVVAFCDPDTAVLDAAREKYKDLLPNVHLYRDYRDVLDDPTIDAVSLATPNHWHSLGAIWGVQAGKDVFVEKPASHNVWEGRQLVEATIKYKRIVQVGSQSRSSFAISEAIQWVRAGNIGKIKRARALCYNRRESIGRCTSALKIPETVDYNLWAGPAPMEALYRLKFHYDWHWFWPTGNGDLGNQGVHQMDVARWALGHEELSPAVFSLGGRLGYVDDGQTPNMQILFHDYQPAPIVFEVRGLPTNAESKDMDKYRGIHRGVSVVLECEGGYVVIPNYVSAVACDWNDKEIKKWEGADNHYANFIKAVRSQKKSDLNAEILQGHLSAALCHTGNISYELGNPQSPEEIQDSIKNNPDVTDAFHRMQEHLAANNVDLSKTPASLGVPLKMDPKTERFTNSADANKMLTRNYRAPFVVPEKV
jgi:predicted dehydrogenase